jgi:predicted aspartyl protease
MHIYTEVELKGTKAEKKVRMLVDTGASRTILPYELALEVGVNPTGFREEVSYGDGHKRELELVIIPLSILGRRMVDMVWLDEIPEPILGLETLEWLGLKVNPKKGEVEPYTSWIARA